MKELLESFFNAGGEYSTDGMFDSTKSPTFEQWYEQNESKIDDAVLNHIKDNYPTLYSAFVIAKLAKQYDIQVVDSKDATPITPELFNIDPIQDMYSDMDRDSLY